MPRALSDSEREQVEAELFAGRKIQAVKLYREATGEGLKEAKDAVEEMEAGFRAASPERFTAAPKKAGCLPMILLAGSAALALLW